MHATSASIASLLDTVHEALVSPLGAAIATGVSVFTVALIVILLINRRSRTTEVAQPKASYYPPQQFPYAEVQVPPYMPPPAVDILGPEEALRPRDVLVIPPYAVPQAEARASELPAVERTQPLPILRPSAPIPVAPVAPVPVAEAAAPAPHTFGASTQPMAAAPGPAAAPSLFGNPQPVAAVVVPDVRPQLATGVMTAYPEPAAPAALPPPPPARITRHSSVPSIFAPLPSPKPASVAPVAPAAPLAPVVVPAPAAAPAPLAIAPLAANRPPSSSDIMELSELDFEDDSPTEFREPFFEELSAGGARHAGIPKIRRVAPEAARAPLSDGPALPLVRQGNRKVVAAS